MEAEKSITKNIKRVVVKKVGVWHEQKDNQEALKASNVALEAFKSSWFSVVS